MARESAKQCAQDKQPTRENKMKDPIIDYGKIEQAYQKIYARLQNGLRYRAVTCDGDIVDGRLTYSNPEKAEIQTDSGFRTFNRSNTKLLLIEQTDTTY